MGFHSVIPIHEYIIHTGVILKSYHGTSLLSQADEELVLHQNTEQA